MGQASFCLPDFKVIKQNTHTHTHPSLTQTHTHTHTHTHPSLTQTRLSPLLDWSVLEHTRDSSFPLPLLFPWRQQVTESRNRICSKEGTPWPSSGWDRALSLQGPPVPTSRGCCILCIQFHSIDGKTTLPKPACGLSCVPLFVAPQIAARQAPLSMEFSRQEYWGGLPFPPPGDRTQVSCISCMSRQTPYH